ncbi:MAG: hypothetical protein ACKV2T_36965 [Kofleriaceae bacterium]
MALTIDELAVAPRWPLEHTLALTGRVRGDTLGAWGENLRERFGQSALAKVRARLPPEHAQIAPVLGDRDRVPVHAQLLITEAIVDEFLDGNMPALLPLLVADTRAGLGRIRLTAMRLAGVGYLMSLGPKTFRAVHEQGTHDAAVGKKSAHLYFTNNRLFAHPTWRVLQVLATYVLFDLVGTDGKVLGHDADTNAFTSIATWT